jgi:uncharacterized protein (DUF697 family)
MAGQVTLARVWRILKEVDLQAIRREAGRRVHMLIIGETTADADDLALRLAEGQDDPTRWLTAVDAPLAASAIARRAGLEGDDRPYRPDIVIAILRGRDESPDMRAARRHWAGLKAHLVTVAVGGDRIAGDVQTRGGSALVPIDRIDDEGFREVVEAVFAVVEPDRRVGLARQIPSLRPTVIHSLIDETARANAGYAFSTGLVEIIPVLDIPLAIGDMVVLSKNQLMMSYRIALAAGKTGQPRELIGEIVGVLGGGLLFRQIARQLVGLLPIVGILPKVAVAYGGTWAIGRAVGLWATEGQLLTSARLRQFSREGFARGREVAQHFRSGIDF